MKKTFYIILLTFNFQLLTLNCDCQWFTQNSGTTQHLYDVYFINTQTGWACGNNGTMLKTNDGGNNWVNQNSGITFPIYSVHFVNENVGYAVTLVDGYFIKTTNGGSNWNLIFFSPMSFESIFFIDSLTGWAAATSGTGWIFKTTNGGLNWDSVNTFYSGRGRDVKFINPSTGWACVGGIFKTTNSGLSWFLQFQQSIGEANSIYFVNVSTGWLFLPRKSGHIVKGGLIN